MNTATATHPLTDAYSAVLRHQYGIRNFSIIAVYSRKDGATACLYEVGILRHIHTQYRRPSSKGGRFSLGDFDGECVELLATSHMTILRANHMRKVA